VGKKIAFIGVPGSGKSVLCNAVQVAMSTFERNVAVCQEYAREFITIHGFPEHPSMQYMIFDKQYDREEMLACRNHYVLCDSPLYFNYLYALYAADMTNEQQRKAVNKLYKKAVSNLHDRYHHVFFLPRQFETVDDGVRAPDHTERLESLIAGFIESHKHQWGSRFSVLRSEETDPKQILTDRVRMVEETLLGVPIVK
jgi:nicotinamide riboside kinase